MAFPPAFSFTDLISNLDETAFDAYDADMLAALKNATSQTPAQTTTEVQAARGNLTDLDERISQVVDVDGNPISELSPAHIRNGLTFGNILANDTFMMWSRGDALAPDYWALSGAGATIGRCGVGQADTQVLLSQDHFSAKLTYGSAPAVLTQRVFPGSVVSQMAGGRLRPVDSSGNVIPGYTQPDINGTAWMIASVYSDGTNRARIGIVDLVGFGTVYSDYHPGNGQFCALVAGPVNMDQVGSNLSAQCFVESAGSAYFQCSSVVLSDMPPMFVPARTRLREYTFPLIATPAAATGYGYFRPARPFHALAFAAEVLGAVPTGGTTLKLDLMTPVGGTFVSLFAAVPAFVASDRHLFKEMDTAAANYRRRTIRGNYAAGGAANLADNSVLRLDVNVRDSGNTATNVLATVIGLEYDVPFNQFRTGADLSEA